MASLNSRLLGKLDLYFPTVAWVAYLLGVVFRLLYVFTIHPPRDHIYTDVAQYYNYAVRLFIPHLTFDIGDTIWPPGTSFWVGLFRFIDPSLVLATSIQALLSCLIPLLIFDTVRRIRGKRAGLLVLIAASLHFGFIHYAGYFLSELPFIFFIALGIWSAALGGWAGAVSAGLSFSFACSFRSSIFFVLVLVVPILIIQSARLGDNKLRERLAQGAIGFLPLFLFLAFRCTIISHRPCLGSHNLLMNAICGHLGDANQVRFIGQGADPATQWTPPVLGRNIGGPTIDIPYSIFDERELTNYLVDHLIKSPKQFAQESIRNLLYTFDLSLWPPFYAGVPIGLVQASLAAFVFLVIIPGIGVAIRSRFELKSGAIFDYFRLSSSVTIFAILIMSALGVGELRYRIPFDFAFLILLSSLVKSDSSELAIKPRSRSLTYCVLPALILLTLTQAIVLYPADLGFRSYFENRWHES
jgi:4-amino-4-deoxy-L-arabinose transferase-like glycosyltransferase